MPKAGLVPLKWHGGKSYLANWIVSLMPRHLNYVEPYCGGCAVLFARDPLDERLWLPPHQGVSEVVNDINRLLINFWNVLRDPEFFQEFCRRVQATPFSGDHYEVSQECLRLYEEGMDGENRWMWAAVHFFVANRQSLAGRMKGFTGITKTRTRSRMNNEVSAWLSCVEGLPAVHERLKRVLILPPQDALAVIEKFDMPETLFYLDPPYLHETRATTTEYGKHEMRVEQHNQLLDHCLGMKAKFMLSGYASPLYDRLLSRMNRHEFQVPNQASGARKKEMKTEVLWTNF